MIDCTPVTPIRWRLSEIEAARFLVVGCQLAGSRPLGQELLASGVLSFSAGVVDF